MRPAAHLRLAVLAPLVWLAFWVLGLPDYYQQYSFGPLAAGCAAITVASAVLGGRAILRARPERRLAIALWLSFYFTVPFALLDALYCGVYLGHGLSFVPRYWYLSIFYLIPWVLFVPVGWWGASRGSSAAPTTARTEG